MKLSAHDFIGMCVIVTSAVCVGMVGNALRSEPVPWVYRDKGTRLMESAVRLADSDPSKAAPSGAGRAPSDSSLPVLPESLSLEAFRDLSGQEGVLVLDARLELFHRLGHIPGAISLPREDFETVYPLVEKQLREAAAIVIYCSGSTCEDAELVKKALAAVGVGNLSIFTGGWAEWTTRGLREEKGI